MLTSFRYPPIWPRLTGGHWHRLGAQVTGKVTKVPPFAGPTGRPDQAPSDDLSRRHQTPRRDVRCGRREDGGEQVPLAVGGGSVLRVPLDHRSEILDESGSLGAAEPQRELAVGHRIGRRVRPRPVQICVEPSDQGCRGGSKPAPMIVCGHPCSGVGIDHRSHPDQSVVALDDAPNNVLALDLEQLPFGPQRQLPIHGRLGHVRQAKDHLRGGERDPVHRGEDDPKLDRMQ
jgi:hypothetical protein